VIPIVDFLIGLLVVRVLAGLRVFVGATCGGAGKLCTSTELVDSVDLRFFDRVGAIASKVVLSVSFENCYLQQKKKHERKL
jgi:hypothetical protein